MGLTYDSHRSLPNDEERFAIVDYAYEIGARFWDSPEWVGAVSAVGDTASDCSFPATQALCLGLVAYSRPPHTYRPLPSGVRSSRI
jgi:hypothetical protein